MRTKPFNRLAIAAGLFIGIAALVSPAPAAEFTLKIGVAGAEDTEHNMAKALKEAVERVSNNRIEVQIFPRNTLGSQSAIIQGMQFGTIEGLVQPDKPAEQGLLQATLDERRREPLGIIAIDRRRIRIFLIAGIGEGRGGLLPVLFVE